MFKKILVSLFMLSGVAKADFAVIQDKDGYTNVRSGASNQAQVLFQLKENEVFYCFREKTNNYYEIKTLKNVNSDDALFIHKSKVRLLSTFKQLTKKHGTSLKLVGFNYLIDLKKKPFDKSLHKIELKDDRSSEVKTLDGFSFFWGSDGMLPYSEYGILSVTFNNKNIEIPQYAIGDLFNPNIEDSSAYYDNSTQTLYLTMQNGDGAGVYHVVLVFKGGAYSNRFVVLDESV